MQHPVRLQEAWGSSMEYGERVMEMPSFRSIPVSLEWPQLLLGPLRDTGLGVEDDASEEDFEFPSVSRDSLDGFESVAAADEIFSDGCIRPAYPFFGRTLEFHGSGDDADAAGEAENRIDFPLSIQESISGDEDRLSTSSSISSASWDSSVELDGVPAEKYCTRATPLSPDLRKKSNSTGYSSTAPSKKWRLRNLLSWRSHSDQKERTVIVGTPGPSAAVAPEKKDKNKREQLRAGDEKKVKGDGRSGGKVAPEMDMAAAYQLYYTKRGAPAGDRQRSFIPYRKNLFMEFIAGINVFHSF